MNNISIDLQFDLNSHQSISDLQHHNLPYKLVKWNRRRRRYRWSYVSIFHFIRGTSRFCNCLFSSDLLPISCKAKICTVHIRSKKARREWHKWTPVLSKNVVSTDHNIPVGTNSYCRWNGHGRVFWITNTDQPNHQTNFPRPVGESVVRF